MEALEAEEEIAVDDLPNFRFEGTSQFDVEHGPPAQPDDSVSSWDDTDTYYEMPDVIRSFIVFFHKQVLDGNVLVPLLFSEAVNLHPVAIVIAVLFFGGLWGLWGVFFAIPLATLVNAILTAWPSTEALSHS